MAVVRARSTRQVGRYQLVYELGQAYVGPLWAARAEASDGASQLAILRLMSLAGLDADTRVRLLEAAWQAMEVRHPHIAAVTDVVASDGELGLISEYVEGLPLRSLQGIASVRKKPIPLPVALRIVKDLVDGAVALHEAMVELGEEAVPFHGGLSADCLFIGADGSCRILDVGVASVAGSIPSLSRHAERAAYSAPEQLAAVPQVDARTDVFALGVLAWELLSSRRLFLGSDAAVVQKVLAGKIPSLHEVKRRGEADIPEAVVAAVARALDRSPDARFQTAAELAEALSTAEPILAPREALAAYVRDVADGALSRLKDGLRDGKSGPRVAAGPREARPRASIALPRDRSADARSAGPVASAGRDPAAGRPATLPGKEAVTVARPAASVLGAPTDSSPAALARPKPALPNRSPWARPEPAAAPPAFTSLAPGIAAPRKRQPTMIGIAPPAPVSAPGPGDAGLEMSEETIATAAPAAPPKEAEAEPEPAPQSDGAVESLPARELDEEPTGQYDARALLSHVEAMERQRESVLSPAPAPSTAPAPGDRPTAAPPPELGTFTVARALPSTFPPPGDPPAPEDGGWLDEPPSPAAPPAQQGPASLDPAWAAPTARRTDRIPPAPSSPPPAFLPSQIPPPLMHDPRAGRATARPPTSRGQKQKETRTGSRVAVGIALSLGLVVVSAAVAVIALRHAPPSADARGVAPVAPMGEALAPPAAEVASGAEGAEGAGAPAATDLPAEPATAEAPVVEPKATEPAAPDTPAATETAEASASAAPIAASASPRPKAVLRPAPRKAPAPKKTGRFVPSDI